MGLMLIQWHKKQKPPHRLGRNFWNEFEGKIPILLLAETSKPHHPKKLPFTRLSILAIFSAP
jgi:hypothetical protein